METLPALRFEVTPAHPEAVPWTVEGISDHALTLKATRAGRTVMVDLLVMPSDRVAIVGGTLAVVKKPKKDQQVIKKLAEDAYQVYMSRAEMFSDHDPAPFVLRAEVTARGGTRPPQTVHFFAPVTTWDDVRAALEGGIPSLAADVGLAGADFKMLALDTAGQPL